jgi:hypothetical protein
MGATARGSHDVVERAKVFDEEFTAALLPGAFVGSLGWLVAAFKSLKA